MVPQTSHKTLNTVDAVLDSLGGNAAVMTITGVRKPQAVSNWRARKRIPSRYFTVMTEALVARQLSASSRLWGMTSPGNQQS